MANIGSFKKVGQGYCQVNLPGSQKPFPHRDVHAAVVAAAYVRCATARKWRRVGRDTRCCWTLKVL
jgi:hypothetical protein